MKNRVWLYLFILAILAAMAILLWQRPVQKVQIIPEAGQQTHQATNAEVVIKQTQTPTNQPVVSAPNVVTSTSRNPNQQQELLRQSVESKNSPIEFYGQVIDQDSNAIPGVNVQVAIRQWYVPLPELGQEGRMIRLEKVTDSSGRFEISGERGDGFDVKSMVKEGYELSPKTPNHFGPANGGFINPVVIKMWRKGASASLVSQDKDTRIPYDGTPVAFDFLTGQKITDGPTSGDLRITLIRTPLQIPLGYRKAFEWHATIEAIDGGLIQSSDEFMNVAPQAGYQPKIQIDMPADAANWSNIYEISFFAKTRGGAVYSRAKLHFRVDSSKPQTGFTISSSANPTGSRNLEQ